MTQYIDKSALVAEIERQRKIYMYDVDNKHSFGRMMECNDLLVFLATLEVKEVDLEKELKNLIGNVGQCDRKLARHFFELGLQVNNPITAADRGMAEEIIINLKRVEQDYHLDLTREMEWLRKKTHKL